MVLPRPADADLAGEQGRRPTAAEVPGYHSGRATFLDCTTLMSRRASPSVFVATMTAVEERGCRSHKKHGCDDAADAGSVGPDEFGGFGRCPRQGADRRRTQ